MTFILACVGGPAWSPDSSKILFAWRDYEGGRYNVAVYDRATRVSRIIFQHRSPKEDEDNDFTAVPEWQKDGTRAIVAMTTEDSDTHCTLFSIELKGKAPPEAYDLGKKTMCTDPGSMPQIGTRLFIGGENFITWLDLSTGETRSKTIEGEGNFIAEHNGQLVYARGVSRPVNDPKNKDAKEEGVEFGRVKLNDKLDDPELKPQFTLWAKDVANADLGNAGFGSWEPGGSRIAMVGPLKNTDRILMLDENKRMTGTLMPELSGVKNYRLGNLVWSHDGKTLFAPAITRGQGDNTYDYSLAEIPLTGAPGRLTRIVSFHIKKDEPTADQAKDQPAAGQAAEQSDLSEFDHSDDNGFVFFSMQVSLSPDETMIAATPANMDKGSFAGPDRALFLVDLRRPTHRVTRIPFPKASMAAPQPAGTAK